MAEFVAVLMTGITLIAFALVLDCYADFFDDITRKIVVMVEQMAILALFVTVL